MSGHYLIARRTSHSWIAAAATPVTTAEALEVGRRVMVWLEAENSGPIEEVINRWSVQRMARAALQ